MTVLIFLPKPVHRENLTVTLTCIKAWIGTMITKFVNNMSPEDIQEFNEMREWYREARAGGRLVKWGFSLLLAVGGAYLMLKQIFHV